MNDIVRSFSNLESRTHWWNLTSSISIAFPRAAAMKQYIRDSTAAPESPSHTSARALKHDLVVQPEPQFRHAGQVALHLDSAQYFRPDDVAVRINLCAQPWAPGLVAGQKARTSRFTLSITSKKTSFFRYLMPSVLHETAFVTAMGGRACISSLCDSWVMYLSQHSPHARQTSSTQHTHYALLQYLALRRLREPKVHHLVHQLVYDDEVVADGLLLELLEVLDQDLRQAMEEYDDLGGI